MRLEFIASAENKVAGHAAEGIIVEPKSASDPDARSIWQRETVLRRCGIIVDRV
ncbi:MAG TPA: hypothetical protein VHQ22_07875 [Terriglobales bacterium]|jgi:hypothetical protein|nr:hypothetical protein [Terriglobales bacterium]